MADLPPAIDEFAERSALLGLLDYPELVASALKSLQASDWTARRCHLWNAIVGIHSAGTELGPVVLRQWLHDHCDLDVERDASQELAEVVSVPCGTAGDCRARLKHVRELGSRRRLAEFTQFATAATKAGQRDSAEIAEELERKLNALRPPEPYVFPGFWATEFGDVAAEPERETWLLHDEIGDKPALPLGRAGMISAAGGTGKTTSLCQLAVSVALGLSWCGFRVQHEGCVVLACAESDRKLMHRHIWRACNALDLDIHQREYVMSQILALPLAGKEVNMLRGTAGNDLERTEFLARFGDHLRDVALDGQFGWALIILDPLSRFAGPDTESNNAAATKFAQAVETLCELPGTPAVLCAHHSSKLSVREGRNDSRGVSGLRDAFRFVSTLTRMCVESVVGVHMECDKSNEAPYFLPRWLVQLSGSSGGALRVATIEEAAMLVEAAGPHRRCKTKISAPKIDPVELVVGKLAELGGVVRSRNWLRENHLAGIDHNELTTVWSTLLDDGRITIDQSGKTKGTVRLVGHNPQTALNLDASGPNVQTEGTDE